MLQTSDYEEHEVTWTDMEQLWMAGGPAALLEPCDLPALYLHLQKTLLGKVEGSPKDSWLGHGGTSVWVWRWAPK